MSVLTDWAIDAAIQLLAGRMAGVAVSGPRDLTAVPAGAMPRTCIVQAVPGPPLYDEPSRLVTYTVRCYGATNDEALGAFGVLVAAVRTPLGPLTGALVAGKWWLLSAALGTPGGPERDPEARCPVVYSTLALHWGADALTEV